MPHPHSTRSRTIARTAGTLAALGLLAPAITVQATAAPAGDGLVINEAYTNGGSANAKFTHKFVELYNPTDKPISLDGWSLQYRSATGTGGASSSVALNGTVPAKGHFLIRGGSNGDTGAALPAPDLEAGGLNFSGTKGTIVLSNQAERLAELPTGSVVSEDDTVVDLLGYGSSNTFEAAAATAPSSNSDAKSLHRHGGADTDSNAADFTLRDEVTPTNSAGDAPEPTPEPEPAPPAGQKTIAEIQGEGAETPFAGRQVTTSGVVTGVYSTGGYNGYYIQTPGAEKTAGASDGLFVYSPDTAGDVALGDNVTVTGEAGEHYGMTQVSVTAGGLEKTDGTATVEPTPVAFPMDEAAREAHEGMLLAPQGEWTVTDNYSVNQYGSLSLAPGTAPLDNPTSVAAPGAEAQAVMAQNEAAKIVLDDGASTNFMRSPGNQGRLPYVDADSPARVGSGVEFTSGVVLDYRYGAWSFQPQGHLTDENAAEVQPVAIENTRPAEASRDDVGGNVTVGSFNVLNYFTTLGEQFPDCDAYTDREGTPITTNYCQPRGAYTPESFQRQKTKIVEAINGMDTSVVALEEVENSAKFGKDRDEALKNLVDGLNAAAGEQKWAYVASPEQRPAVESEDVIRNAFIYQPAEVTPVGESRILDDQVNFDNAREPLAQLFRRADGSAEGVAGTEFVAITNHFKSKGGSGATGDNKDSGDGQGNYNGDRVRQAQALVAFAEELKTELGTERVLLLGDFNSYEQEDPIAVLEQAGYVSQGAKSEEYSYVFGGAVGDLDGVFASPAADATVTGQDIWMINANESVAFEYSRHNYTAEDLYAADQWRSSDHNPIVVGMDVQPVEGPVAPEDCRDTADFADNPVGSRYYSAVRWMQCAGITTGYADGTFLKGQDVTRAESVAFLYRYLTDEDVAPGEARFPDVPATHTHFESVQWAVQEMITRGYADGTFKPGQDITRAEFASMLHRAVDPEFTAPTTPDFPDVAASNPHYEAIAWLAAEGLSTGYRDGTFKPEQQISRGEIAVLLHRYELMLDEQA